MSITPFLRRVVNRMNDISFLLNNDIKITDKNKIKNFCIQYEVNLILEGYSDLNDCKECYNIFKDRELITYDAYGFSISPNLFNATIQFVEKYPVYNSYVK